MARKLDLNVVNCVLLVVILILVIVLMAGAGLSFGKEGYTSAQRPLPKLGGYKGDFGLYTESITPYNKLFYSDGNSSNSQWVENTSNIMNNHNPSNPTYTHPSNHNIQEVKL